MLATVNHRLARDGFAVIDTCFDDAAVDELITHIPVGSPHARRNLLDLPCARDCVSGPGICSLVEAVLGCGARAVRAIFFDKTPDANWKVPWHQDLSIAVRARRDVPAFGPWSLKQGVVHVQPPRAVLGALLTVRVHLDHCGEEDGPLRVVAGSHASGVLSGRSIAQLVAAGPVTTCLVPRGGALLMRPLLLHASSPARTPTHRRVLHLEFAPATLHLPGGLEWHWALQAKPAHLWAGP